MSFASRHNSASRKFNFAIPDGFEYKNLAELAKEYGVATIHKVNALYINKKGKYGDAPVIVTDNELVNAPGHMLDTILEVLIDGESLSLINNGYVGFKVYGYTNDHGEHYGVEWVDIDPKNYEPATPVKA